MYANKLWFVTHRRQNFTPKKEKFILYGHHPFAHIVGMSFKEIASTDLKEIQTYIFLNISAVHSPGYHFFLNQHDYLARSQIVLLKFQDNIEKRGDARRELPNKKPKKLISSPYATCFLSWEEWMKQTCV